MTTSNTLTPTAARLAALSRQRGDASAIVEDGMTVHYRGLAVDLAAAVLDLRAMGLRRGHQVGIEVRRDRYTHLLLIIACQHIGAATWSLPRNDLSADDPPVRTCDLLLTNPPPDSRYPGRVRAIPPGWARRTGVRELGPLDAADLAVTPPDTLVASIIRTSGTTSQPKTMALTHGVQRRVIQMNGVRMARDGLTLPVSLCLYGLAARAVLMRVLAVLHMGGTVIFGHEDHAAEALSLGLVNQTMLAVGDVERIIARTSRPPNGHDVHVELFGSAVTPRLREIIGTRLTGIVRTRYSSNETGVIADMDEANVGTLGDGVSVRIVNDEQEALPNGQTGLIHVRTPTMVSGYLGDPEATRAAFVDGWFRTQDLGFMPAPDRLVVVGRADGVLDIGGIKLSPEPLEEEIRGIPGIVDAALVRAPNARGVGRLIAAIETADGKLSPDATARIETILRRHLHQFRIVPLSNFPRTATAKVQRAEIIKALARDF